jgi:hypothetical protein
MNAPNATEQRKMSKLDEARALYPEIRALSGLASPEWSESYNLDTHQAEICIPNRFTGEVEPIAQILLDCPYDDRRMMFKAPVYIAALLTLLEEAFNRLRSQAQKEAQPAKEKYPFAKACAILSGKQKFRQFLREMHGLEAVDDERVNTRIRSLLTIESRTQLDTDENARERWFSLCREFDLWERQQRSATTTRPKT